MAPSKDEQLRRLQVAFMRHLEALIREGHEDKHALFVEETGPLVFDDESCAYAEGLRRFGLDGVFLLTRISRSALQWDSARWNVGLLHAAAKEEPAHSRGRGRTPGRYDR